MYNATHFLKRWTHVHVASSLSLDLSLEPGEGEGGSGERIIVIESDENHCRK